MRAEQGKGEERENAKGWAGVEGSIGPVGEKRGCARAGTGRKKQTNHRETPGKGEERKNGKKQCEPSAQKEKAPEKLGTEQGD